jgi:hypothetical protein
MAFTMVFKLCLSAEKRWRRLNGAEQMTAVITGAKFQDGVRVEDSKSTPYSNNPLRFSMLSAVFDR